MPRLASETARKNRNIKIIKRLAMGESVSDVAKSLGLSRKFVHDFANENGLPTNPTVVDGGPLEDEIFAASHVCSLDELSVAYNIAQPMLKKIVARARLRWKKHIKQLAA